MGDDEPERPAYKTDIGGIISRIEQSFSKQSPPKVSADVQQDIIDRIEDKLEKHRTLYGNPETEKQKECAEDGHPSAISGWYIPPRGEEKLGVWQMYCKGCKMYFSQPGYPTDFDDEEYSK